MNSSGRSRYLRGLRAGVITLGGLRHPLQLRRLYEIFATLRVPIEGRLDVLVSSETCSLEEAGGDLRWPREKDLRSALAKDLFIFHSLAPKRHREEFYGLRPLHDSIPKKQRRAIARFVSWDRRISREIRLRGPVVRQSFLCDDLVEFAAGAGIDPRSLFETSTSSVFAALDPRRTRPNAWLVAVTGSPTGSSMVKWLMALANRIGKTRTVRAAAMRKRIDATTRRWQQAQERYVRYLREDLREAQARAIRIAPHRLEWMSSEIRRIASWTAAGEEAGEGRRTHRDPVQVVLRLANATLAELSPAEKESLVPELFGLAPYLVRVDNLDDRLRDLQSELREILLNFAAFDSLWPHPEYRKVASADHRRIPGLESYELHLVEPIPATRRELSIDFQ